MAVRHMMLCGVWCGTLVACTAAADDDVEPTPPLEVTLEAYVKGMPSVVNGRFGDRVALSADGTTLAAGASGDGGGSVEIYVRGAGGGWTHQHHISPSSTRSFEFGSALALSNDGNTLAVGAKWDMVDCACPGPYGAVYVYSRSGGVWGSERRVLPSRQGEGFFFGDAVALSADGATLAVGANGTGPSNQQTFMGAVHVFERSADSWNETTYLPGPHDGADFGLSVALSGDAATLAVGARGYTGGAGWSGAVEVYVRDGSSWPMHTRLVGRDTAAGDFFGWDVALSGDGSVMAVSSTQPPAPIPSPSPGGTGAVYMYNRAGPTWNEQAKLVHANAQLNDSLGSSIALDDAGLLVFATAPGDDAVAVDSGAVYAFRSEDGVWTQQAHIKASNAQDADAAGMPGIAVSRDGARLAFGAVGEDSAATGVDGDQNNESLSAAGAVYVLSVR
jgi:trimeric autotransporter adhesin